MSEIYLQEDNGGRGIAIKVDNNWYYSNCAPTGHYGDVNILEDNINTIIENLKNQSLQDGFEADTSWMDEIEAWENLTIEDIEKNENEDCTCDFTTFTFVCDIE